MGYKHDSHTSEIATDLQEANGSRFHVGQARTGLPLYSTFESTRTAGLIKVSGLF